MSDEPAPPPSPEPSATGDDGTELHLAGRAAPLVGRRWPAREPAWVALLVHGYGEHVGRYEEVAARLTDAGAAGYGVDHVGHGRSGGERVLIEDFERVVDDVHLLAGLAAEEHPGLPVVLVGHSMGGLIGARYAQRHGEELAAVVLTGPVLGEWEAVTALLGAEEIPETPIDPATLSRDPAVGEAYVADPLVWHGPFKRQTLEALAAAIALVGRSGPIATVPMLWLHGEEDQLVPIGPSRAGWRRLAGPAAEQRTYPGARHEILNETNRGEVLDDLLAFVARHVPGVRR